MTLKKLHENDTETVWGSPELNTSEMKYHIFIVLDDYIRQTGKKEAGYNVGLYVSKVPAELTEEQRNSIKETFGFESVEDITPYDVCEYGIRARLEAEGSTSLRGAMKIVARFKKEAEVVDSLLGFYLDKPQNAIGNNGWNFIHGDIGFEHVGKKYFQEDLED